MFERLSDISPNSEHYLNYDEDEVVDEEGAEDPSMDFEVDSEDSFDDYGGYLEEEEMEPQSTNSKSTGTSLARVQSACHCFASKKMTNFRIG